MSTKENISSSSTSSTKKEQLIAIYIQQLSPIEKMAMEIAQQHLGTSFDIQKSNGFIEWYKTIHDVV